MQRTWEDPTHIHPDADGTCGDNDPLDVCDIGLKVVKPGDVRPVKVLGVLCMIDEGETDWKVVVIDAEDKWAPFLNDINDVEEQLPGTLEAIREWFRTYKVSFHVTSVCTNIKSLFSHKLFQVPDGKPENKFGLDEKFMDKAYALDIIKECNQSWKELITGEKERKITHMDEGVQKLVRKLSKSNLLSLCDDDEAPTF